MSFVDDTIAEPILPVPESQRNMIESAAETMRLSDQYVASLHVGYSLDGSGLVYLPDTTMKRDYVTVRAANHAYGSFRVHHSHCWPQLCLIAEGFPSKILEDGVRFLAPYPDSYEPCVRDVLDHIAAFHMAHAKNEAERLLIAPNVYGDYVLYTKAPDRPDARYAVFFVRTHENPYYLEIDGYPHPDFGDKTFSSVHLTIDGVIEQPAIGPYAEMQRYVEVLDDCPLLDQTEWEIVLASAERTYRPYGVLLG